MSKKQLKQTIINMKNDVDKLLNEKRHLERKLNEAELLNKVLIDSFGNDDTTLFNYNGDTYGIKEITFNKTIDKVDTLDVEMVKRNIKVEPHQGGLIDSLNGVAKSVGEALNKILYVDKKE